jgi:hypothetical protein
MRARLDCGHLSKRRPSPHKMRMAALWRGSSPACHPNSSLDSEFPGHIVSCTTLCASLLTSRSCLCLYDDQYYTAIDSTQTRLGQPTERKRHSGHCLELRVYPRYLSVEYVTSEHPLSKRYVLDDILAKISVARTRNPRPRSPDAVCMRTVGFCQKISQRDAHIGFQ